jgi:hypothetical protein
MCWRWRFSNAGADAELMEIDPQWLWAAFATAFASFSGMLDDCGSYDGIRNCSSMDTTIVRVVLLYANSLAARF